MSSAKVYENPASPGTGKQILQTAQEMQTVRPSAAGARHHKPEPLTKPPLSERMNDDWGSLRSVSDRGLFA